MTAILVALAAIAVASLVFSSRRRCYRVVTPAAVCRAFALAGSGSQTPPRRARARQSPVVVAVRPPLPQSAARLTSAPGGPQALREMSSMTGGRAAREVL